MIKKTIVALIRYYQKFLSPLKFPSCRFTPTCSSYAIQVLETHGLFKGLGLFILRILKCHPFHPGGYDSVTKNDTE